MKSSRIIIAITLFSFISTSIFAQANNSLRDENRRIKQGVMSGQLTAPEVTMLKIQESKLRAEALRYKCNDGHIGPLERADLRGDNRRLSRNIFRQKHDRQTRF
jgi:hypothetical protein